MYVYELTTWTDTTPATTKRGRNTYEDRGDAWRALCSAVNRTNNNPDIYASGRVVQIDQNGEEVA
jgi:hypothetical protein